LGARACGAILCTAAIDDGNAVMRVIDGRPLGDEEL